MHPAARHRGRGGPRLRERSTTRTRPLALSPETLFSTDPAPAVEPPPEILDVASDAAPEPSTEIFDIAREAMGEEPPREEVVVPETIVFSAPEPEEPFVPEATPTTILTASEFEDETVEPPSAVSFAAEEPAGTVIVDAGEMGTPSFVIPAEEPTVFYSGSEPEPTPAMPPEPEPAAFVPPPPPPPPVAPPEPPKAAARPKAETRPARPAPRAEASRPAKPAAARARSEGPVGGRARRPRASSGAAAGRYAAMGLAALVVIGAGAWGAMRFLRSKPEASPPPTLAPVAQNTPIPPPISQAVAPEPEPSLAPEPEPTALATPPVAATPTPRPSATPSGALSPSPSPRKGAPTPAPTAAAPATPSAESQRAAQVASLLGQGEASLGARQYDAAIGHFDEVLRLDPGNAKASADRASAVALRDASRKKFVPGRTVVKTEKATGSLSGFDTGDVALQKAPDFLGRIDFEMSPASGIKPGDDYSLKIILVNEGKKPIRIQGLSVNTMVNGSGASAPTAARVREVQPQQRAELGEVSGSWRDGTTSWSTEVLVTANKGDSLKNTIAWR